MAWLSFYLCDGNSEAVFPTIVDIIPIYDVFGLPGRSCVILRKVLVFVDKHRQVHGGEF